MTRDEGDHVAGQHRFVVTESVGGGRRSMNCWLAAHGRMEKGALPSGTIDFAEAFGLTPWLERHYR